MSTDKQLFVIMVAFFVIAIFTNSFVFSMKISEQKFGQQGELIKKILDEILKGRTEQLNILSENVNGNILRINEAMGLAHSANGVSIKAFEAAMEALSLANRASSQAQHIQTTITDFGQHVQAYTESLEREYDQLSAKLKSCVDSEIVRTERVLEAVFERERGSNLQDKLRITEAKIDFKDKCGIYEKRERILAHASVETEKERWKNIKQILGDYKFFTKIAVAIIVITLSIYIFKYGIPMFLDYFLQPRVIIETSNTGLFSWFKSKESVLFDDLVFAPSLQNQLVEISSRVKLAREYNEALPNVIFYGASGTGKTAFAKALAYSSGLDYALTSGSEFAKITDLKIANNKLRRLLNWAKRANGLIIFIDEAESLFANRRLSTTPKITQDFINTFLSLISDQSQKKLMFIFATNHPYKLDDSIVNRTGLSVEFTLPKLPEREKILFLYLSKFAKENEYAVVEIHPEIKQRLSVYAESLEGLSPRALRFVAEEMIIASRLHDPRKLTNDIAQAVIRKVKYNSEQIEKWKETLSGVVNAPNMSQ